MNIIFGVLSSICMFLGILFSVLSYRNRTEEHLGYFSWKYINPFASDYTERLKSWYTPKGLKFMKTGIIFIAFGSAFFGIFVSEILEI